MYTFVLHYSCTVQQLLLRVYINTVLSAVQSSSGNNCCTSNTLLMLDTVNTTTCGWHLYSCLKAGLKYYLML
jgi:hypothetical protein